MSVKSNLIEYYAQRAGEYERVYGKPERQEELRQLKELIKSRLAGRNVLEVACGTGYWTEVAATSAHTITAFDINEAVLAIARGKSLDPRKVTFQAGDAYQPPGRGDFDAALVAFWWSHVPKQKLAGFLRAPHKTLRPGAVVIFAAGRRAGSGQEG